MNQVVIVANGEFLVSEIIHEVIQNKTIVALDGAAKRLAKLGITPHIIVGDFDSTTEEEAAYWGITHRFHQLHDEMESYVNPSGVIIVPRKNQNYTDLAKAIQYCDEHAATHITIICAMGKRLDLQEANLRLFRSMYKKDRGLLLHTSEQTICFAKDQTVIIVGQAGDKCGIIAYPKASFSSQGLLYETDNFDLNFGYSESTANELISSQAKISVQGEALLIMPPQLNSQREFKNQPEIKQLEMLLRDLKNNG